VERSVETDEVDKNLLAYIGHGESWHTVCAVFHYTFPESRELVDRIWRLREGSLLSIEPRGDGAPRPTKEALLADAVEHEWHSETSWPAGPVWELQVMGAGWSLVDDRGEAPRGKELTR
jgi:hypothetical protein